MLIFALCLPGMLIYDNISRWLNIKINNPTQGKHRMTQSEDKKKKLRNQKHDKRISSFDAGLAQSLHYLLSILSDSYYICIMHEKKLEF